MEVQTRITTPSAGSAPSNPAEQFMLQQEMDRLKRSAEEDAHARAAAERAESVKQARCAHAKQELAIYGQAIPIAMITPDGQRTYLSDTDRARKISDARQVIAKNCN